MATTDRPTGAAPHERAWDCPGCGETLAYIRGRSLILPDGDRYEGCVRASRRCPACFRLVRVTLVGRALPGTC